MLTIQIDELLRRLNDGVFDSADTDALEKCSPNEFLAELEQKYPCRFQERHVGNKWEAGFARQLRHDLAVRFSKSSVTPRLLIIPIFRQCLFISGENQSITGIGLASRLVVKPINKPIRGFALISGDGYKLDKSIDGWYLKAMERRTVRLSEEQLQKRGWRFEAMWNFVRAS